VDRYDAPFGLGYLLKSWNDHVEVAERRVAPPTVVVGFGVVWWAEVGGRDNDRSAWEAPLWIRLRPALNLVAPSAAQPIVKQRRTQSHSVSSIPLAV
jgi:hypothetical protein